MHGIDGNQHVHSENVSDLILANGAKPFDVQPSRQQKQPGLPAREKRSALNQHSRYLQCTLRMGES